MAKAIEMEKWINYLMSSVDTGDGEIDTIGYRHRFPDGLVSR